MSTGSGLFTGQKPVQERFTRPGGVAGEVGDLRSDVSTVLGPLAAVTVEEFTNVAAASVNAILLAKACTLLAQDYAVAALDGAVGGAVISPPRNITVTTSGNTAADAPATATITGLDINGDALTETINVPQTATTAVGAKAFAKVTAVALSVGQGTDAAVSVGIGNIIGLGKKAKVRAGAVPVLLEVAAGAKVTTGTFAIPSTGVPNGTYAPSSAPNGTNDYAVYYEYDTTA